MIKLKLKKIQEPIQKFINKNNVSIITGDAGTGKSFISLHTAITHLTDKHGKYEKVVLCKPIVEVGRSLGLLPGDVSEKVEVHAQSLYDIINELLPRGENKAVEVLKKKIAFEPVNFVRGKTFKFTVIILTEAQNLTLHELVSLTTRLDSTSKLIIEGDLNQSDIGRKSGFKDFIEITENIKGMNKIHLGDEHQTRNKMIIELTKSYQKFLEKGGKKIPV